MVDSEAIYSIYRSSDPKVLPASTKRLYAAAERVRPRDKQSWAQKSDAAAKLLAGESAKEDAE